MQAHRVAANAGYIGEHFIYHREMEAMELPPPKVPTRGFELLLMVMQLSCCIAGV